MGKGEWVDDFFSKRGGFGILKNPLISVMNQKKRHIYLVLMLNLKVSKQTRSEARKDKAIIKRVSNKSIN